MPTSRPAPRFPDGDVRRVPVGPGALQAERYGYGGPEVVLLHGFGTTSFLWREVAPRLAVGGMTAYTLDLLGYGASDRPIGAAWDIRAQAGYIAQALAELQVSRATIVGNDVGAAVALCLALAHPARVASVVLVSPPPFRGTPGPDVRQMQRASARHVAQMIRGLFGVRPLLETLLRGAVSNPELIHPRLLGRYMAPYTGRDGVTHFLALANAIEEDDLEDVPIDELQHAALVLYGEHDRWCSPDHAEQLARSLPEAVCECVGPAGRLVAEELPDALAARVLAHAQQSAATAPRPASSPPAE